MGQISDYLRWSTIEGQPLKAGNMVVTPISQSLIVRLPFGGFIWNRPVAIRVENEAGEERIAIVDVTRRIQLGLILSGLGLLFVTWLLVRGPAISNPSKE